MHTFTRKPSREARLLLNGFFLLFLLYHLISTNLICKRHTRFEWFLIGNSINNLKRFFFVLVIAGPAMVRATVALSKQHYSNGHDNTSYKNRSEYYIDAWTRVYMVTRPHWKHKIKTTLKARPHSNIDDKVDDVCRDVRRTQETERWSRDYNEYAYTNISVLTICKQWWIEYSFRTYYFQTE